MVFGIRKFKIDSEFGNPRKIANTRFLSLKPPLMIEITKRKNIQA